MMMFSALRLDHGRSGQLLDRIAKDSFDSRVVIIITKEGGELDLLSESINLES